MPIILTSLLIFTDILTKEAAIAFLKNQPSTPLLGHLLRLTYGENTGSAFSQFQGMVTSLIWISFACILFVFYAIRKSKTKMEKAGYYLILSGATGNLIDRLFRGYVVDFLDFDFFDIHIPSLWIIPEMNLERWPVFNFADSYICIGVSIVLLSVWLSNKTQ